MSYWDLLTVWTCGGAIPKVGHSECVNCHTIAILWRMTMYSDYTNAILHPTTIKARIHTFLGICGLSVLMNNSVTNHYIIAHFTWLKCYEATRRNWRGDVSKR